MTFFDYIKATEILVGLIVVLITSGASFFYWLHRRFKKIVAEANPVDLDTARRVKHIERDLGTVKSNIAGLTNRVSDAEKRLETVATQKDMADIKERLSAQEAGQRYATGMLHSIHEAILRAGKNND